ncbi:MAG: tetratricopeptide repeat protein [Sandaracinaceae bacterium]|nr:tetratricopeptide repeat protein [Myxococcales bacterium]MCB9656780.1 tetratricopeptide repeat protein [Sandaracinaceae bacterium]
MGGLGSGRRTLAAQLCLREPSALHIDFLAAEWADAAAAALLQLSAATGYPEVAPQPGSLNELRAYTLSLVERLEAERLLVLSTSAVHPDESRPGARSERLGVVLQALRGHARRVEIGAPGSGLHAAPGSVLTAPLEPFVVRSSAVEAERFGAFQSVAEQVTAAVGAHRVHPVALRLAIGAAILGTSAERAAHLTRQPASGIPALARCIVVGARQHPALTSSLRRLVALRRPLQRALVLQAVDAPETYIPLLTECVGYGDPLRVPDAVARQMRAALGRGEQPDDHARLAATYRTLDGVNDPADASAATVTYWVEKLHHLAHGGADTQTEWQAQRIVLPDLYWDRGRAASLAGDFAGAVRIFERCVREFPDDDYAHHYLGYNLLRSKAPGDTERAEASYRRAIELTPSNPRWNRRLVCSLIRHAPAAARAEWELALGRVDPYGDQLMTNPWLRAELLAPVASAWLQAGRADLAKAVIGSLPEPSSDDREEYRQVFDEVAVEHDAWTRYLDKELVESGAALAIRDRVEEVWRALEGAFESLVPLPYCGLHPEGGAELAWRLRDWYVRVEFPDDPDEYDAWTVINPEGRVEGGDLEPTDPVFLTAFRRFLDAV